MAPRNGVIVSNTNGTIGVGVALTVMTIGGLLVYTALKGKGIAAVLGGDTGGSLNPAGGSTGIGSSDPAVVSGTPLDPTNPTPGGTGGLPGVTRGTTVIDGFNVANWLASWVLCARKNGWTGQVTSGYRTDDDQCQACIHVCGNCGGCSGTCASPGSSNHRGTTFPLGAVDVSDPDGFARALRGCSGPGTRPRNALPNDRGHFSATGH